MTNAMCFCWKDASTIYHPDSPVNILSTRRLAEKFSDEDGNPDEDTKIESRYSTHCLTWCFGQFKKTFPTPVSGLPELISNKGFQVFQSYYLQVESSLPSPAPATVNHESDSMLFMMNQSIKFNNGDGTAYSAFTLIQRCIMKSEA